MQENNKLQTTPLTLVKNYIYQTLTLEVDNTTSLIYSGLMDSISVANLIMELENAFSIKIPESDLNAEQFETPEDIAQLMQRLSNCKG